jgi:elongation factor P
MLSINNLKVGTKIKINDEPFEVLEVQHSKLGRGGAILRTKIKGLISGSILEKNFQQFTLSEKQLSEAKNYLIEEMSVKILNFEKQPIKVSLPPEVNLKVIEAPPGIKGNTAESGTKIVVLKTGLKITVPLHIEQNDVIKVKTGTGKYVGKV